jgi:SOS-response transcriptional repressor LexA
VELTPRQADVILTIRNYRHLHGHAPTFSEIADTLRISRGTAVAHVKALIRKKKLRHTPGRARTLEVVADMEKEKKG